MSAATLPAPAVTPSDLPQVERCPACLLPLVADTGQEIRCAAGHRFYQVGMTLIARPYRMVSG